MICRICKQPVKTGEKYKWNTGKIHLSCLSEAERSGAPQAGLPSATGSADARASDEAGADSSERSADGSGSAALSGWTQKPPDRDGQGYWWWWNGDEECAPSIITVMYSGCSDKCFVCLTDDQLTRDVDSERWSGWWKAIKDEAPPTLTRSGERACLPNADIRRPGPDA